MEMQVSQFDSNQNPYRVFVLKFLALMQSDSVDLAAVVNVLKSADKLKEVGQPGHIYLVSIDGTPLSLRKIRDGGGRGREGLQRPCSIRAAAR